MAVSSVLLSGSTLLSADTMLQRWPAR